MGGRVGHLNGLLTGIFMASSWHLVNNHLSFQLFTKHSFVGGYVFRVWDGFS